MALLENFWKTILKSSLGDLYWDAFLGNHLGKLSLGNLAWVTLSKSYLGIIYIGNAQRNYSGEREWGTVGTVSCATLVW